MMKRSSVLILPILLALRLSAATVTLTGVLHFPFGGPTTPPVNCTLTLTLNQIGTTGSGSDFAFSPFVYRITGGNYNLALQPNDSLTPSGTSYHAAFSSCLNGGAWEEDWVIPSSPSTTTIGAVRVSVVPSPNVIFNLSQISKAGAVEGACIKLISGQVVWSSPCGSSGGSLTWSGLTNGQWTSLTNGQWTSLGN